MPNGCPIIGGCDLGLSALFAATYPEQVTALVLGGVAADGAHTLVGRSREEVLDAIENSWGDGTLVSLFAPSQFGNREFVEWWGRMQRSAVSPGMARKLMEMTARTNLRAMLPTIRVPTLVVHRTGDRVVPVECGRRGGRADPGGALHRVRGRGRLRLERRALAVRRRGVPDRRALDAPPDRVLATVLFTDIVGSTEQLSRLGDGRWRAQLEDHDRIVRARLRRWRGREIKTSATASWPPSTGRRGRSSCAARDRGTGASNRWGSRFAPACTPASARCAPTTSPGSRSTSRRA